MYDAKYVCEKLRIISKLSALAEEGKFRSGSYTRAAESIETNLDGPIEDADLQSFHGIGAKLAKKIDQIIKTGTCTKLDDLMESHGDLLPLLEIPGVGPAKALNLYYNHEAHDLEDVKELVRLGIITDKRIVEGVQIGPEERIPHQKAYELYCELVEKIDDGKSIRHIQAVGSLRRMAETCGDLDIVVLPWSKAAVATKIRATLDTVSDDGDSKIGGSYKGVHVDFRFCKLEDMGAMLLYFTGSKEHCIFLRKEAIKRGWTLNEYELHDADGNHIAGGTEEEIYKALDMDFIPPKDRE